MKVLSFLLLTDPAVSEPDSSSSSYLVLNAPLQAPLFVEQSVFGNLTHDDSRQCLYLALF
jgi:hypothetical protein